ncbi:MAG: hypothetical protein MMC33_000457 [Icmadophila ericetorum]|nr:hypothetical protein [Icmadophila ericetorum]
MALKHASSKAAIAGFTPVNRNGHRASRREIESQQEEPEGPISINHQEWHHPQEPERINQIRKITTERSVKRRRVESGQHEAGEEAAETEAHRVKLQSCDDIFCNLIRDIMPVVGPADLEASFRRAFTRVCNETPKPLVQDQQSEVEQPQFRPPEGSYQGKQPQSVSSAEATPTEVPYPEVPHPPVPRIEAPYAPTAHLYQPPPQGETPYAPTINIAEPNLEGGTCSPAGLVRKARAIKAIRSCWGLKSDMFDLDSRGELYLHQLSSISKKFTVENAAVLVTKTTIRRLRSTLSGIPWRETTYKDWKAMKGLSEKETEELMNEPDLTPEERAQYEIPYGLLYAEKIGDIPESSSEVVAGGYKPANDDVIDVTSNAE